MNKIIALGNLGRSASVRSVDTAKGSVACVSFSLAVKIGWGDQERTQWYDCAWWGDRAERVAQWLTTGKRVLVEGEPELQTFEKKDGTLGAKIAVRVVGVDFCDSGRSEGQAAPAPAAARPAAAAVATPAPSAAAARAAENLDEDVPF